MAQQFIVNNFKSVNFRNLSEDIISFTSNINCIFGNNGQGKTNILEAIHLLCTGKSFRKKASFPQLISIDSVKPEIILSATFIEQEVKQLISAKITKEGYQSFQNSKQLKKRRKWPVLMIAPFDSFRFFNESDFKRYWFDNVIGILDSAYSEVLKSYQKTLRHRNKLLSTRPPKFREQIKALDENLSEVIVKIEYHRIRFVNEIKKLCSGTFFQVFSEDHTLSVHYNSNLASKKKEEIVQFLDQKIEKDLKFGFTTSGPHRENFELNFDGFSAHNFCSIGQQKMAFISLVFAYIELFRYKFKAYPLLLLDDISGELDQSRWQNLLTYIYSKNFQILITTANREFEKEILKLEGTNKIHIDAGKIGC